MTTEDSAPRPPAGPLSEPEPAGRPPHEAPAHGTDASAGQPRTLTAPHGAHAAPGAPEAPAPGGGPAAGPSAGPAAGSTATAATATTTGAGAPDAAARTTVLPSAGDQARGSRPERPRPDVRTGGPARPTPRPQARPTGGRGRRARLVLQRVDPWSVFLFSLVASICLGIVLLVAVATLYAVLSGLGVLSSVNDVLGEVLGGTGPDEAVEPFFTAGRVLGATAVLAAVDVVLLTVLATLGALLYNLCASLTGGVEVVLGERD